MSKIMVVDDNKIILQTIGPMLEKEGYEVIIADSGDMCLEILKDEKPDLILMDVMMPLMDGWETVEEIRKDEANRDIIISMLTVKARERDKAKSLDEAGADWHIAKPIAKEKLLETVHWLLTKK